MKLQKIWWKGIILITIVAFGFSVLMEKESPEVYLIIDPPESVLEYKANILPESPPSTERGGIAFLQVSGDTYESDVEGELSVYEFMKKIRTENKIDFKDKTYLGMGKLIEEINGQRSDGSRNWIYYVNGERANIGVSNYWIKPGDIVSWKYKINN